MPKINVQLTIPVEIELDLLNPEDEQNFVTHHMPQCNPCQNKDKPGACVACGGADDKKWLSQHWHMQIAFQHQMLTNHEHFINMIRQQCIENLTLNPESIEDVVSPIAKEMNAENYFVPEQDSGFDSYAMLGETLSAIKPKFGKPKAVIETISM